MEGGGRERRGEVRGRGREWSEEGEGGGEEREGEGKKEGKGRIEDGKGRETVGMRD